MKTAVYFLVTGIFLTALFLWQTTTRFLNGTVDVHFGDTYYILPLSLLLIMLLLFWSTLFFVGALLSKRSYGKWFWISFVVCVSCDLILAVWLFQPLG
jgi:hypothetical protein